MANKQAVPSLDRPDAGIQRTVVSAQDRKNGSFKSVTVYNVTPEEVIDILTKAIAKKSSPSRAA